ncbi:hypothetical protein [Desulfonatronum sp. SC1]|uniref:hypothetical protein n=1 Tax=Desulfonatronum sp. SC1 TaxID=2109626 RepID=UPI000D2FDAC7|nr:hypothetical protein [Desulfonatronum sp. SC1]PTN37569.1 hypothetical protein C6366_06345 [Desulfonatronum sp. SC1]
MRMEDIAALVAPDVLLPALGLAGLLLPGLIAMGAVFVAVLTAATYRKSSKVFADKLAKQMSEFGMLVLGVWLLLVSARWGLWIGDIWPVSEPLQRFYHLFFDIPGHVGMLAVLTSIIVARAWRRHKNGTAVHFVLGGISCLAWMAALVLFVAGWLEIGRFEGLAPKMDPLALPELLQNPTAWLIWAQGLFLALALAGGAGLLFLVARRNKEDYGRDYYAWAARTCAARALSSGVVQTLWGVAAFAALSLPWADMVLQDQSFWLPTALSALSESSALVAMLAFLFLSPLAWLSLVPLIKSQHPMRLKGLMLGHVVIVFLSLTVLVMTFHSLF